MRRSRCAPPRRWCTGPRSAARRPSSRSPTRSGSRWTSARKRRRVRVASASAGRRSGRDAEVPVSMDALAADLELETIVLQRILQGLTDEQWKWPTPAPGWSVADQVSHLAHSDEVAVLSATDRAGFEALVAR